MVLSTWALPGNEGWYGRHSNSVFVLGLTESCVDGCAPSTARWEGGNWAHQPRTMCGGLVQPKEAVIGESGGIIHEATLLINRHERETLVVDWVLPSPS
jgi:hypothetical protein